jgi:glycosyltransferase involved in cell wall biosynthesis
MRLLLVNETARVWVGGANRVVVETCALLAQAGHQVALAYCDGGPSEAACPCFAYPRSVSHGPLWHTLASIIREVRPDVVQVHWVPQPGLCLGLARLAPTCQFVHDQSWFCSGGDRMARDFAPCRRPHRPTCLLWHYAQGCGGRSPWGNWRRWRQTQARHAARACAGLRFQVASEFMRRGLLENGYPSAAIDLVPLYAQPPTQPPQATPGSLLLASRLVRGKGVDLFLHALPLLPASAWRAVIAGDGPQRSELESLTGQLGLCERVEFLGELTPAALEAWYARAAVVVHPTLRPEPFGMVGPEAMARGKPVVAFAGGATEEWLVDGVTGLIVRERSADALARALERLLGDPALAESLGRAGRERWTQFRPEAYLARLLESFERCRQARSTS